MRRPDRFEARPGSRVPDLRSEVLVQALVRKLMHLDTLKDEELAGRAELAESQAPGMHPELETKPNVPGGGL